MSDCTEMKPVIREDGTVDAPFLPEHCSGRWPFNVPTAQYSHFNEASEPYDHFTVFEPHMILDEFNQVGRMKELYEGKLEILENQENLDIFYLIYFYSQL